MTYTIVPMEAAHAQGSATALTEAFRADPLFTHAIPDEKHRMRWLPHLMAELVGQTLPSGRNQAALDSGGRVVGALCTGPYPPAPWNRFRTTLRLFACPSPWVPSLACLKRFEPYQAAWDAMHCPIPHEYVYIIGVHPAHQHRGLGHRLMAPLVDWSRASGVPIYLETQTERNLPFYVQLGFELTDEKHPHPDGPRTWALFRQENGRSHGI